MPHILDRPAWNALTSVHASFAEGGEQARRYPPSIIPFAAAADYEAEGLQALCGLARAGEAMALIEAGPVGVPQDFETMFEGQVVQMIADRPFERMGDDRVSLLTEEDADEMLALATLTKPGPFTRRAQSLGSFWGVRIDGRLAAMAGQRMRQPGFAELSGLCTHPDFLRQGLGALLFRFVAGEIHARGETAYLHAFLENTGALALYEKLGFRLRSRMNARLIRRLAEA